MKYSDFEAAILQKGQLVTCRLIKEIEGKHGLIKSGYLLHDVRDEIRD